MNQLESPLRRARRSLSGLWLGDAFGGSFFWKADLAERVQRRELSPAPWRWSDDTAMARAVVACLEQVDKIEPDLLARLFAEEYTRDPVRGYGAVAHSILYQIGAGVPWAQAAGEVYEGTGSCGNGAAMRVGPVGAYFAENLALVLQQARLSAVVTHAHPEGQAGALAVAAAAAWAAQARPAEGKAMLEWAYSHTPAGATRSNLERACHLDLKRTPSEAAHLLGSGQDITAQDTVPFALWCAARHLDDYAEALWACVEGGGDLDTTCAIAGSVVALSSRKAIPPEWLTRAEPVD